MAGYLPPIAAILSRYFNVSGRGSVLWLNRSRNPWHSREIPILAPDDRRAEVNAAYTPFCRPRQLPGVAHPSGHVILNVTIPASLALGAVFRIEVLHVIEGAVYTKAQMDRDIIDVQAKRLEILPGREVNARRLGQRRPVMSRNSFRCFLFVLHPFRACCIPSTHVALAD